MATQVRDYSLFHSQIHLLVNGGHSLADGRAFRPQTKKMLVLWTFRIYIYIETFLWFTLRCRDSCRK